MSHNLNHIKKATYNFRERNPEEDILEELFGKKEEVPHHQDQNLSQFR